LEAELELEAELKTLIGSLEKNYRESEAEPASAIIAVRIPEAPYSIEAFKWLHRSLDLFEGVHASISIFGPQLLELLGAIGLGIEVLAPFAGFVGSLAALGAGYSEGREVISKRKLRDGFAFGFVMGAHPRAWSSVKEMFWERTPEVNTVDEDAGKVAQQAFNLGLATGFLQGKEVAKSPAKSKFFWTSLNATLLAGDRNQFFDGSSSRWSSLQWRNYYIRMGSSFITQYLKD
jgi:uncharacterized protein YfiM (DUF2279 family)